MHEVVTLQFGQQANYLGTHYWNVQESYFTYAGQEESPVDHDISFRPGIGADGTDTYTPRTLIYDLKGAFGTLRRENALYDLRDEEQPNQQLPWTGSTVPLRLDAIAPSTYQQALDQGLEPPPLTIETVRFWSDYNHVFYHPRSLVQLNEYELHSSLMPFEFWQTGEDLFSNLDREHDLLDRDLRPFLEECDQLQAIQILSGVDDAWGGFAARYLERIQDELGKGCRWLWALEDGRRASRERQMVQATNVARSVHAMGDSVSTYIPLSSTPASLPSYVSTNPGSRWHTSALQALVVESFTLPTRLRNADPAKASYDTLEALLNNDGKRRVMAAKFSIQDPSKLVDDSVERVQADNRLVNGHVNGNEDGQGEESHFDMDFLPATGETTLGRGGRRLGRRAQTFSIAETLRGQWETTEEILETNLQARDRFVDSSRRLQHQSSLLFPNLPSFPHIIRFPGQPHKLATRTSLSTSSVVAERLRALGEVARRLGSLDEREALSDGLDTMAEEYEEGWDDFDVSDDDD